MARPYHHGDLKAALLDAAETILREEGIAALTLREAARRAGVSHAAPKHHFGDLNGLLSVLAAHGFRRFAQRLAAAMARTRDAPAKAAGRAYVEFARENRALFLLMFADGRIDARHPELRAAAEEAFAVLASTAAEPSRHPGQDRPDRDRPLLMRAARNWALVHGFAMLQIDGKLGTFLDRSPGLDLDQLLEEVLLAAS